MIFVYVITMDAEREARTHRELKNAGVSNISLVPGVDGNTAASAADSKISQFCQMLCSARMRGCALAHANAWELIAKNGDYENTDNIVLIVEDDIRILKPHSFVKDVHNIVRSMAEEWDVISLFCQGLCSPSVPLGRGSTAAYVLSRQGCERLNDLKIGYHVDFVQNALRGHLRPLVDTYDDREEGAVIGNQTVTFWANQDILGIGSQRLTIRGWLLLLGTLLVTAWLLPKSAWLSKCVLITASLFLFVFVVTLVLYFSTPASFVVRTCKGDDRHAEFIRCISFLLLFSSWSLLFLSGWCTLACTFVVLSLYIIHAMNGA